MGYIKYINDISLVSSRIEEILNDDYFDFSMEYLKSIHKYLFKGILLDNGMFRTYDISKHEFTLNEKSVIYANHNTINTYLEYDFNSERKVNYNLLSEEEKVRHIADFTSRIWQTHPFSNGNTRTILVFIQKYLRQYGIYLDNSLFKDNSKYFRGALVKSAYYNQEMGIHNDLEPLSEFFRMIMYDNDIILDEDKLYEDRLFKKRNEIELLDSKYINYLIDKFKKCYGIDKIENNDRFKLLFSTWIDKMKRDINNFSLYLDYLDISICDRKICEVGHGKLDSLLYNTKHRGLVLRSNFNELCHEMGNTFFEVLTNSLGIYQGYLNSKYFNYDDNIAVYITLLIDICLVGLFYFLTRGKPFVDSRDISVFVYLVIISMCLDTIGLTNTIMSRISGYFYISWMVLLPLAVNHIRNGEKKLFIYSCLAIGFFLQFLVIMIYRPQWYGVVPYTWYF